MGKKTLHAAIEYCQGHPLLGRSKDATESGRADLKGKSLHFLEHEGGVGLIGATGPSITGRQDSRLLAESINFQTRVIGQHNSINKTGNPLSLEPGILLERDARLLDLGEMLGLRGISDNDPLSEHGLDLAGLVSVPGCQKNLG